MVSIVDGRFTPIPFDKILDPQTKRTRVRMVDVNSESYRIAREFMIRLGPEDVGEDDAAAKFAAVVGLRPKEFRERFAYVVEDERTRSLASS